MDEPVERWVRTNRRVGACVDLTYEQRQGRRVLEFVRERVPGRWHAQASGGQTWCGRQPVRVVSSVTYRGPRPPEGDRVCRDCERALRSGSPDTNRNRGRRGS
jgi:hypothetical protein